MDELMNEALALGLKFTAAGGKMTMTTRGISFTLPERESAAELPAPERRAGLAHTTLPPSSRFRLYEQDPEEVSE